MDILELIEKNKNAQNTIFIVDPPYLNTNVYKNDILTLQNKEFGYKEHVKLAKLLRQITKEGKNNDFIYFCRITATRKKDQKTKKTTNLASLPAEDRHMEGMDFTISIFPMVLMARLSESLPLSSLMMQKSMESERKMQMEIKRKM